MCRATAVREMSHNMAAVRDIKVISISQKLSHSCRIETFRQEGVDILAFHSGPAAPEDLDKENPDRTTSIEPLGILNEHKSTLLVPIGSTHATTHCRPHRVDMS